MTSFPCLRVTETIQYPAATSTVCPCSICPCSVPPYFYFFIAHHVHSQRDVVISSSFAHWTGGTGAGQGEGNPVVYARGPIAQLPEEHASRRERFAELDDLQPGWQVGTFGSTLHLWKMGSSVKVCSPPSPSGLIRWHVARCGGGIVLYHSCLELKPQGRTMSSNLIERSIHYLIVTCECRLSCGGRGTAWKLLSMHQIQGNVWVHIQTPAAWL